MADNTTTINNLKISVPILTAALNAMAKGTPILLVGPVGCGKHRFGRVLAMLRGGPLRAPHHTVSNAGMMGGKRHPGEVSLANGGTLYLDDMPEFMRPVLAGVAVAFDCKEVAHRASDDTLRRDETDFYLIAGSPSCPCGRLGSRRKCECSSASIDRYHARHKAFTDAVDCAVIELGAPDPLNFCIIGADETP